MSLAIIASGTLIKLSNNASSPVFTTIPESMKIGCPNCKFDLLDVTSHDSAGQFKQYIPGLSDGENVTDELNWVPTNTIHTQIRTDSYARTLDAWEIIFPGGGTGAQIAFNAYIVGIPPVADIGQVLRATITAKVTGLPVWT